MIIDGRNSVLEALKEGLTIDKLLVTNGKMDALGNKIVREALDKKIKVQFVDRIVLDKHARNHQGFVAFVTDFVYSELDDILEVAKSKGEDPFILILDSIEDPHNLGSLIRSGECMGVHGIVIPKHRSVTVNDTVIKVSEGATLHMKVAKVTNINSAIEELKEKGVWIMGTDMSGEEMRNGDLKGSIALVVGNEGKGISPLTKKNCDKLFKIPMKGKTNSLNASVAGGIFIYEAMMQRRP